MPKRWLPGDYCEVRIKNDWVAGEIKLLYKHFARVEVRIDTTKTTTVIKSFGQIREPQ